MITLEQAKQFAYEALLEHPKRYQHTLNVVSLASKLALEFDVNPEKAMIAAFMHDTTKYWSVMKTEEYLSRYMSLQEIQMIPYPVRHAYSARYYAIELGLTDEDIVNAINYHTTARPRMSTLEKIIFISDFCEESREYDTSEILKIVHSSIDKAVLQILNQNMFYLASRNESIMTISIEAIEYYKNLEENH